MNQLLEQIKTSANYQLSSYEIEELLVYDCAIFQINNWQDDRAFPLADEAHIAVWHEYQLKAQRHGTYEILDIFKNKQRWQNEKERIIISQ